MLTFTKTGPKTSEGDGRDRNAPSPAKKRQIRNRKPVVLIQNQYDKIYASTYRSRKRSAEEPILTDQASSLSNSARPSSAGSRKRSPAESMSRSSSRLAAKPGYSKKAKTAKTPIFAKGVIRPYTGKPIVVVGGRCIRPYVEKVPLDCEDDLSHNGFDQDNSMINDQVSIEETSKVASEKPVEDTKGRNENDDEFNENNNRKTRSKRLYSGTKERDTPQACFEDSPGSVKRKQASRTNSESKNNTQEESLEINESISSYGDIDEDLTEEFPDYPKAPITEGSTTEGHIRVGHLHQAIVPRLITRHEYKSSRPDRAIKVWRASAVAEDQLNSYLDLASSILTSFMKKNRFYSSPTNTLLRILVSRNTEGNTAERKIEGLLKEFNADALLALLHAKSYDVNAALKSIERSPESFLELWDKQEQEIFHTGFCKYFSNLRMVAKGLSDSKTHKHVVDYHYRYNIPEQFRRYQESKLLQARRMLQAVENRRMQESSNENRESAISSVVNVSSVRVDTNNGAALNPTSTPAHVRKYRHWFGGVSISELEKRRASVRDFLLLLQDTLGQDNYDEIIKYLGEYRSKDADPARVRACLSRLFMNHSSLYKRFQEFLPQDLRK